MPLRVLLLEALVSLSLQKNSCQRRDPKTQYACTGMDMDMETMPECVVNRGVNPKISQPPLTVA